MTGSDAERIEALEKALEELRDRVEQVEYEIAVLKMKAES